MTHYHLNFANQDREVVSQVRYEHLDDAIISFLDMCYYIFPDRVNPEARSDYVMYLYGLLTEEESNIVMMPSKKLTVGVMRCPYERCSASTDN